MKKSVSCIALLVVFGLLPMDAASQERWGALFWTLADERYSSLFTHIPWSNLRCHHVASIAWNYPTKREAMVAARKGCREEWRKTGVRHRIRNDDCGDMKSDNPITGGTVLGVIFGPGQCAAYATGQRHLKVGVAKCPISGEGIGMSKPEAERRALADCRKNFRSTTCKIKLSACNAPR